jgi:O-antigen ligase
MMPLAFSVLKRKWGLLFLFSAAEIVTFSRGPYITGLLAVLALLVILRQGRRRIVVLASVLAALLAFAGPLKTVVKESYSTGSEAQANLAYRQALISESFQGVTLFGDPVPQSRTDELFADTQFTDVTSYLALTIRRLGLLGLIAWIGLLGTVTMAIVESIRRKDDQGTTLGVIVAAWWTALLSVSLITNFQFAFWLVLAALATRGIAIKKTQELNATAHPLRGQQSRRLSSGRIHGRS